MKKYLPIFTHLTVYKLKSNQQLGLAEYIILRLFTPGMQKWSNDFKKILKNLKM